MPKSNLCRTKKGEFFSRTSYIKVVNAFANAVEVQNEQGVTWQIIKGIFEAECFSASQFDGEPEYMTRTQLVEKFNSIGNAVYTVNFNKQPKLTDAFDAIANKGEIKSNKELKKLLSKAMDGEERTLIGYTVSRDVALGRSMVVDLEQSGDDRLRQVDHRSLNWFICQNVKYQVKSK